MKPLFRNSEAQSIKNPVLSILTSITHFVNMIAIIQMSHGNSLWRNSEAHFTGVPGFKFLYKSDVLNTDTVQRHYRHFDGATRMKCRQVVYSKPSDACFHANGTLRFGGLGDLQSIPIPVREFFQK